MNGRANPAFQTRLLPGTSLVQRTCCVIGHSRRGGSEVSVVLLSWNMPGLPNGEVFHFIVVEKVTWVAPEGTLRPAGRTLNVTHTADGG